MKKLLIIITLLLISIQGWSQREIISLTFNAKDSLTQSPLNFDSINIYNVTVDCDTTLFNGVSELTMEATWVNLEEISLGLSASFEVMQNTPNPFQGKTIVRICLKNKGMLHLEVFDNKGNKLSEYQNDFDKGWHLFSITTKASHQLFLRVFDNSISKTIKMMSTAPASGEDEISFDGDIANGTENLKSLTDETGFIIYLGNQLRYTAFIDGYHDKVLYDSPVSSETYIFSMLPLTIPTLPTVFTSPITEITQISAIGGGEVLSDGGSPITGRGVCWGVNQNPTTEDNHSSDGSGMGSFTSNITGLDANTTYFVRSYATNSIGISYGDQQIFTTLQNPVIPTITTTDIISITQTTALSGGNITSDGGAAVISRGVCWNTSQNPTINENHTIDGSGTGSYISNITGLNSNTIYYVRAYAINNIGTAYGDQLSFITLQDPVIPTITTTAISNITQTTATSGGNITSDGGTSVTSRGVCWGTNLNPTTSESHTSDGNGTGSYVSNITGLVANTFYYVRAYAVNSVGTAYGENISFATQALDGTVVDIDGNVYTTVVIGTQTWLAQNLKAIHYQNGDPIPNVIGNSEWEALNTGAYSWYQNDESTYSDIYGAYYNWFAVVDSRKLCPVGYHVSTNTEWTVLEDFLNNNAGGKLKETGIVHWLSPNLDATNETLFTSLGGSRRQKNGYFPALGNNGYFWSATILNPSSAWARNMSREHGNLVTTFDSKQSGLSVRCVLDSPVPIPIVVTNLASDITQTTATSGGNVISDCGYNITSKGVCWSTNLNPTITDSHTVDGNGTGEFISNITELSNNTLYYVRAYAINSQGIGYGENMPFTTQMLVNSVTDIDGNVYSTIVIGTQEWMSENLKVTHYRNGDIIPNVTDNGWTTLSSGAYCWYNNDEATYRNTYGALYNWFAVADDRDLCPTGWHIPSESEYSILNEFIYPNSGGKLKESGTIHWQAPNSEANNLSGFTGLPGGHRYYGSFLMIGFEGHWWSSSTFSNGAYLLRLLYNSGSFYIDLNEKKSGVSVRCVKD